RREARLVSEYADGLIVRRRAADESSEPDRQNEGTFDELLDLVRVLDGLEIVTFEEQRDAQWRQLQTADPRLNTSRESSTPPTRRARWDWLFKSPQMTAAAAAFVIAA